MPQSHVIIFHNKHSRSTPLDPKLMFWCVSFRSGTFGTVSLLHETRCKMGHYCNKCKTLCNEVMSEFFAMNTPDPHHWTQNSCFGAFLSILGAFGTGSQLPRNLVQ